MIPTGWPRSTSSGAPPDGRRPHRRRCRPSRSPSPSSSTSRRRSAARRSSDGRRPTAGPTPSEDDRWVDAWRGAPFGEGHSREAVNVMEREVGGRRAVVFDYSYKVTTSDGKTTTTTTYEFSIYAHQLPAALPDMTIEPEGLWDKAVKLFGAQDVELESVEFNDRYRVKADDPEGRLRRAERQDDGSPARHRWPRHPHPGKLDRGRRQGRPRRAPHPRSHRRS